MGCSPSRAEQGTTDNVPGMRNSYDTKVEGGGTRAALVDTHRPSDVNAQNTAHLTKPTTNSTQEDNSSVLTNNGDLKGEATPSPDQVLLTMADSYHNGKMNVDHIVIKNDVTEEITDVLPDLEYPSAPADFHCLYSYGRSKWPIPCYASLEMSVNAYWGGCAGILLCSNSYGGKGEETTAEVFLYRAGFSGNHYGLASMSKSNSGHFGCRNVFTTDENGKLIGDVMFGSNQLAMMTSDPRHGNLQLGVRVTALEGADEVVLPLDVNGEDGAGNTLVLCSGWEVGSSDAVLVSAVYTVRSGQKDNFQQAKLLCGADKWSFSLKGQLLKVAGPSKSTYSLYHNRKERVNNPPQQDVTPALAGHMQAENGEAGTVLAVSDCTQAGVIVVMCSNSSGEAEEATCTALYLITVGGEKQVDSSFVKGLVGKDFPHGNADLWTFKQCQGGVSVTGPSGPCRYGYFSNLHTSGPGPRSTLPCLATGEETPVQGAAHIDTERVIGWVNKKTNIKIIIDKTVQLLIPEAEVKESKLGTYAFAHNWSKEEKRPGLRLVAVVAERRHIQDGTCHDVPLSGAPRCVAWQPPGVVYALNCAGQSYEASDGIIYESEFSKFANFTYDFNWGSQSRALGMVKHIAQAGQLVACTTDGFMYVQHRTPYAEAVDEKTVNYKVEGLPKGKYTLRLHTVHDTFADITVNGARVHKQVEPQVKKQSSVVPGCSAHIAEIPVTISDNTLTLAGNSYCISGFALYDKTFTPKTMTKEEMQKEESTKRQLADSLDPLTRTMTRKARKLVGWSRNLLLNSSAERGDLTGWNIRAGDWAIHDGGYGTEKAFKTSHMWCIKHQEVLLTEEFAPEYLDTAPSIQVSEWYREGVCGGGHYYFKAVLLGEHGNVIKEHILPETGRIYNNNKWIQEAVTFKNYGPGVRSVYLESRGKDDKYWGGHYGIMMSAATVRVQREAIIPDDDGFEDIKVAETTADEKQQVKLRDTIVGQLLLENAELMQTMAEDGVVPDADSSRMTQLGSMQRPKQRKKREIRVFVSSTFRDFTEEREELIKKTFREINQECTTRGVFFTYVDLRWGISEEQTNHGQTIAICLQEIDRCRPYFICLMGDRYGWAQKEDKEDKLLDNSFTYAIENFRSRFGWIDQHRKNTSVTMLEVLHGVLNDVDINKSRSFFYLRNTIQPGEVDAERYKRLVSESDWHKDRQDALRRMVLEQSGLNTRRYRHTLEVCGKIKKDLMWCLDQDFPLGTELTPLEREREAHIAFADARCRVYIGREDYFTHITDFVNKQSDTPIVIMGESGSGKSALVANWVRRMEETFPTAFIFVHFIGSSAESASYIKLLRRLYEELKLYYGFQLPVPQSDKDLTGHLSMWLRLAGEVSDKPCIIVLDALNQLDSGTGQAGAEHDLLWIPRRLPSGVSLVMSTLPGRAMDAVTKAGWAHMKVEPLHESEKIQIVSEYLEGIYGKTLNEQQKGMIVSSKQTNNPLYLKALLDEVRMFGNFRQLTAKIEDYLFAQNPPELFARILSRFEEDFETGQHKRPNMVRQMTSAIWCSNKGMSEAELLDLLQIPSAVWSPFYLSVVDNLVNRNGILNFFHDHLRQAVETKYLPTEEDKKKGYLQVADYFARRPMDSRAAEELPFLLANAGELDRLKTVISDLTMFSILVRTEEGKFDLIKSWTLVGGFSQTEEIYMSQLAKITDMDPDELTKLKQVLAEFFMDLGLFAAARTMLEGLVETVTEKYKASHSNIIYDAFSQGHSYVCNHPVLIDLLYTLGSVCEKQNDFDIALDYFSKAIGLQKSIESSAAKLQLTEGVLGQATVLYRKQDMKTAKNYLLRAQELATEVLGPRHHYVAAIINKLGQLSYEQGLNEKALGYFLHDLRLTRADVGLGHPRVAGIINDIGLVYDDKNDTRAGQYYEAALQVLLARYGNSHPDVAVLRFNLGSFYFATFYFSRAKFQFTEALKVFDQFLGKDHPNTQETQNALNDVAAFTDN